MPELTDRERSILSDLLVSCGFAGLARCVWYMPIGVIESRVGEALARQPYEEGRVDGRMWFRLFALKQVFRRLRKPLNDEDDWLFELGWAVTR